MIIDHRTYRILPGRVPAQLDLYSKLAYPVQLRYMTTNNLLGCEIVLITGEVLNIGGKHLDAPGYDLLGLITGSEGLLGVVTEVTVRILKRPETARALLVGFPSSEDAGECVSRIIGAGIIPGGMPVSASRKPTSVH